MAQHMFPPPDFDADATRAEQEASSVDAGLVARAVRGDSDAFATLFDRHAPRIYALAYRIAGREAEAEDITQDAFLHALNALPTLRRGDAFGAWVARIATNLAWTVLRGRMRLPQAELTDAVAETHPDTTRWGSPEAMGLAAEDQQAVRLTLDRLAPTHRAALAMREIGGLSYADIAASLGTTSGSVEVLLFRARARFRDEYRKVALGATAAPAPDCGRTPHVLAALADREGSAEDRARAAAHARRCNACATAVQGQKSARKLLLGAPLALPSAIKAATLSKAAPLLAPLAGSAGSVATQAVINGAIIGVPGTAGMASMAGMANMVGTAGGETGATGTASAAGAAGGATGMAGATTGATSLSVLTTLGASGLAIKIAVVAVVGAIVTAAIVIEHRPFRHIPLALSHGSAAAGHGTSRKGRAATTATAATRLAGVPGFSNALTPIPTPTATAVVVPVVGKGGVGGTKAGAGITSPRAVHTAVAAVASRAGTMSGAAVSDTPTPTASPAAPRSDSPPSPTTLASPAGASAAGSGVQGEATAGHLVASHGARAGGGAGAPPPPRPCRRPVN